MGVGRVVEPRGYVLIRVGKDHPLADCRGYAYEHRLVAYEEGRLQPGHLVHHDDEVKGNNASSNLETTTRADHVRLHKPRLGTGKSTCGRGHPWTIGRNGRRRCYICQYAAERRKADGHQA